MQTSESMNALAIKAKNDPEALLQLWQGFSRLAYKIASRYQKVAEANIAVDMDDLRQCAFLGFYEAVQGFDPLQGTFPTMLSYGVRRACRRALGIGVKERTEYHCTSLDAPVPGTEDITLADTIPDETAADAFDQTEMHNDIEKALSRLPEDMAEIIRLYDLQGLSVSQIAEKLNASRIAVRERRRTAFRSIRAKRLLEQYKPVDFRYKTLTAFRRDWSSVVEDEVIRRLDGFRYI
jgi:RNA polymerase sporulation-specific sigma factor